MAIGKNPKNFKNKTSGKKRVADPFEKKAWYEIRAPAMFKTRSIGYTPANKTAGTRSVEENLMGRIFTVSLGDLNDDEDHFYQLIKLKVEEVKGKRVLTNFHGLRFTTDKLKSLVRKWQSLIEAYLDVKTTDGYTLRLFAIGFTTKQHDQVRKTCYATSAKIKLIRQKMFAIMKRESAACTLRELVEKLVPNTIGSKIKKACSGYHPMKDVYIHKVKIIKAPKLDSLKLMELHAESEDVGKKAK